MLTHIGTQIIETEHLILRKFEYSDADSMLQNWVADEAVQSMYSEPAYQTKAAVLELLERYIRRYERLDSYRWAIIHRETGACIGQIAFFLVDRQNHFAEIEYCIGAAFQCRGYATEATQALIRFGFEQIHLHKIQICTKAINAPSKRVIEKCGFTYEGTLRDYFYMHGAYVGRLYYSMLADEYHSRQSSHHAS